MSQLQLANSHAPIYSIPLEISGEILMHVASSIDTACGYHEFLNTVTSISKPWRAVALSTRSLWAKIAIPLAKPLSRKYIETSLSRAGSRTLEILVSADGRLRRGVDPSIEGQQAFDILKLLMQHVGRWRELTIRTTFFSSICTCLQPLRGTAAALQKISLSYTYYSHIYDDEDEDDEYQDFPLFHESFKAPILHTMVTCNRFEITEPGLFDHQFPALEFLQYRGPRRIRRRDKKMEVFLEDSQAHPALRTLQFHTCRFSSEDVISYLALTELCFTHVRPQHINEFLKELDAPNLTTLKLDDINLNRRRGKVVQPFGDISFPSRFPSLTNLVMSRIAMNMFDLALHGLECMWGSIDFCQSLVISLDGLCMNESVKRLSTQFFGGGDSDDCPRLSRLELDYRGNHPDLEDLRTMVLKRTVGSGSASPSSPGLANTLKELHVTADRAIDEDVRREFETYLDLFSWTVSEGSYHREDYSSEEERIDDGGWYEDPGWYDDM